jgi:ABC-2 type transport system ATP-binding protein
MPFETIERHSITVFAQEGGSPMALIIEARGLTKRFGKTQALAGLDLAAESGQVVALLGPNGAGKTTFIRTVATLLQPDGGELRVAGFDVRRQPAAVRRVIGLAGQFAAIEPTMTGRENLEMVARLFGQNRKSARANSAAVLGMLGLTDAAGRLVRTYSGGMRRKLDLGASLVGAPKLLLLDEPTTGLDPRSRIELWDAIRALVGKGTDVLLTTQYLDEADNLASHVVIIDHGRVVASGTPSELKQRVGGKVIEVHVRREQDVANVARLLGQLDHGEVRTDQATRQVSVSVEGSGTAAMNAMRVIEDAGVDVEDLALRQPRLDEVFLALTGQPGADAVTGQPAAGAVTGQPDTDAVTGQPGAEGALARKD